MTENTGSSFEPLSDEELARLLEEQMRALRGEAPVISVATEPVITSDPAPIFEPAVEEVPLNVEQEEEDEGIAALFGALLEDTSELEQVSDSVVTETVVSVVDYDDLAHTQPITYFSEEVVSATVVDEHLVVEEIVVEEVFTEPVVFDDVIVEDAHLIAARVISEISIDGEVVATTVSATAGSEPIPQMFGDFTDTTVEPDAMTQVVSPAAVFAEAVIAEPILSPLVSEQTAEATTQSPERIEPTHTFASPVESELDPAEHNEATTAEETGPLLRSNSPVSSFAPRPSFDELVFGVSSED